VNAFEKLFTAIIVMSFLDARRVHTDYSIFAVLAVLGVFALRT